MGQQHFQDMFSVRVHQTTRVVALPFLVQVHQKTRVDALQFPVQVQVTKSIIISLINAEKSKLDIT